MSIYDTNSKEYQEWEKTLPESSRKWNLLWKLWVDWELESPIFELMTYDAEVHNGGHDQYFANTEEFTDLEAHVEKVLSVLPPHLAENLKRIYQAYIAMEQGDYDEHEYTDLTTKCDMLYYDNSEIINQILQERADKLTL